MQRLSFRWNCAIVIVLTGLALVAAVVWIYLALGHVWFWRTDVRLPEAAVPAGWPAVSVVVPARDEAALLPITLPTLLAQDYPGPFNVLLVDDRSTDGTAAVGRRLAATATRALTVVTGREPPPGWTGKLWALQQGLDRLSEPAPEFVLFIDADIAHPPDSLRRLVAAALASKRDVVSLMALLPAQRRWERLLIPAFVYFFAQLYPFRRVNRAGARTAAAAGSCLLVRVAALRRAGGLESIRGAVIDDVALARLIKCAGGAIWLGLSSEMRSCRPYLRLADVWAMVARSAFTQLRYSYVLLALTVLGLILTYLVPPLSVLIALVALVRGGGRTAGLPLAAGAVGWAIMAAALAFLPVLWPAALPSSSGAVAAWTAGNTVKVLQSSAAGKSTSIFLAGARNEVVSFQIIVAARAGSLDGVNAVPRALTSAHHPAIAARQSQLYRETYQRVTRPSDSAGKTGEWPDGLIPIGRDPIVGERRNGAPFSIPAGGSGAIWVDIAIPAHQPAGRYHGSITVSARGRAPRVLTMTLRVWNFAIPSQSSLPTAFGFDNWAAYQEHYGPTWDTGKIVALTKRYAEAALQLRFSLFGIGVAGPDYRYDDSSHRMSPLDWSAWDATEAPAFNDGLDENGRRLTSSELPVPNNLSDLSHDHHAEDVAFWRAVAQHYRRRGWLSRSFLYTDDEPSSAADYRLAGLHAQLLHQADPHLRYLLTTAYRPPMVGKVNIWVPIINELDSSGYPRPGVYYRRQAAGDEVWWYDSDSSADRGQWPDMFIDHPAMNQRVLGWMTWRYHLQGFLYYEVDYAYSLHNNPWTNVYFFGTNGDGTLFYPGKPSIIGGETDIPCPSIRALLLRQSLQDYEYMRLLAQHGRRADADRAVRVVVRSSNSFTKDPAVLERARRMMGEELSSLR